MSLFSNIHKIASRIIPRRSVLWRKYETSHTNEYGMPTHKYSEWHSAKAHVEPGVVASFGSKNIDQKLYNDLGLSWSDKTFTVWIDDCDLNTLANQNVPDQIKIDNHVCNVIQVADWLEMNGWKRMYLKEVIDYECSEQESS